MSESTLVKMPHCWKSHGVAQMFCLPHKYEIVLFCTHTKFFVENLLDFYRDGGDFSKPHQIIKIRSPVDGGHYFEQVAI